MLAHGFTVYFLVDLIRAGMATTRTERVVAGGRAMEVARVTITEAGRRALAELRGDASIHARNTPDTDRKIQGAGAEVGGSYLAPVRARCLSTAVVKLVNLSTLSRCQA
jgi:hypothetical protein